MADFFTLDGGNYSESPNGSPAAAKPVQPVQGTLFAMHVDRQRKPAARLAEPSLMDFLADHPKLESK